MKQGCGNGPIPLSPASHAGWGSSSAYKLSAVELTAQRSASDVGAQATDTFETWGPDSETSRVKSFKVSKHLLPSLCLESRLAGHGRTVSASFRWSKDDLGTVLWHCPEFFPLLAESVGRLLKKENKSSQARTYASEGFSSVTAIGLLLSAGHIGNVIARRCTSALPLPF